MIKNIVLVFYILTIGVVWKTMLDAGISLWIRFPFVIVGLMVAFALLDYWYQKKGEGLNNEINNKQI